jgi:hypothetical protein
MMAFLFQGGPEDGRVMFFNSRAPKAVAFMEPQRRLVQYVCPCGAAVVFDGEGIHHCAEET